MPASSQPARPPAIQVTGLRKSYAAKSGDKVVIDAVDLTVAPGTVHALLGPNGSGKTTTVHILSTLIRKDAGTVLVGGADLDADPEAVRRQIGLTGQFSAVDGLLTGRENLHLMGDLAHLGRDEVRSRASRLLDQFDLNEAAEKTPVTYSGGMRRRLDLAMTLMVHPPVIFLDEPTTGLDPRSRRALLQVVRDLVGEGVTVFLTTQYLEEADQLADRISVLDHGRIIAEGSPAELKRLVTGGHLRLEFASKTDLYAAKLVLDGSTVEPESLTLRVPSDGGLTSVRSVLATLDGSSLNVTNLSIHLPDLDDVFLALTGSSTMSSDDAYDSIQEVSA